MKRILTIGRDSMCDIHINDNYDIVSRNHATIEVARGDKYFITDTSSNGTYVNGIRIPAHQRFQVQRGDEVSLAHTAVLDWALVPKDNTMVIVAVSVLAALVVVAAAIFSVVYFGGSKSTGADDIEYVKPSNGNGQSNDIVPGKSGGVKKKETPSKEGETEKAKGGKTKDAEKAKTKSDKSDAEESSKEKKEDSSKKETAPVVTAVEQEVVVDAIY